jgi:hypothetical protein
MARLDPSRTAVELDEDELAVVGLLLTDPDGKTLGKRKARAIVEELQRAGVLVDDHLEGYVARMMAVIGDPQLRVVIERFANEAPQVGPFAAVRDEFGVWCEKTRDGTTEFTPVEPGLVPWAVSRAVGLGPRAEPGTDVALELRGGVLQMVLDRLSKSDTEGADRELEQYTSLDETERRLLIKLFLERRLSWRAFSVWQDDDGEPQSIGVSVVDGGESGLWLSDWPEYEPNPSEQTIVRLEPTSPSAVWDRVVGLVPLPTTAGMDGPDG